MKRHRHLKDRNHRHLKDIEKFTGVTSAALRFVYIGEGLLQKRKQQPHCPHLPWLLGLRNIKSDYLYFLPQFQGTKVNTTREAKLRGELTTIDLLIKVAFCKIVYYVCIIKSSLSELVSTWSNVLSLPLQ